MPCQARSTPGIGWMFSWFSSGCWLHGFWDLLVLRGSPRLKKPSGVWLAQISIHAGGSAVYHPFMYFFVTVSLISSTCQIGSRIPSLVGAFEHEWIICLEKLGNVMECHHPIWPSLFFQRGRLKPPTVEGRIPAEVDSTENDASLGTTWDLEGGTAMGRGH